MAVKHAGLISVGNSGGQYAEVSAYAESDEVQVWNYGSTSAGGDGISANSTAVAVAKIEQQADQENSTSQNAEIDSGGDPAETSLDQDQEGVSQANFNTQSGQTYYGTESESYYATAYSNEVQVWSYGNISAGGDGIDAESKAVAVAEVDQQADQDNTISQDVDVTVGDESSYDRTGPVAPCLGSEVCAKMPAEIGQDNFNTQSGEAEAQAYSDEVQVWSYGNISADGDGISAESNAVAVAKVEQAAEQQNTISQEAEVDTGDTSSTGVNQLQDQVLSDNRTSTPNLATWMRKPIPMRSKFGAMATLRPVERASTPNRRLWPSPRLTKASTSRTKTAAVTNLPRINKQLRPMRRAPRPMSRRPSPTTRVLLRKTP